MPTSTVFSAKHHKCLSTLPLSVFSPSYAMNSGARGLRMLGFPWAYAEVTKLVLKMSSSILFFAQFERSYYLRSFRSLFSIAATTYCCVRTAAIASYDDVGRSPVPQPIEMSLNKTNWLMYVNYLKVSALVPFSFASSKTNPQGFCFQEKVHVMEGPQTKSAIQFCLLFF